MSENLETDDAPASGDQKSLLDYWRMIETDAVWFVLANFLDAAMTWIALMRGGGPGLRMVEGNRVAAYFLNHWGFKGMFGLKLAVVTIVCVIAVVIARSNPRTAQRLLKLGTLIVILVVLYSVGLYFQVRGGG
jgi:hypothetical protein